MNIKSPFTDMTKSIFDLSEPQAKIADLFLSRGDQYALSGTEGAYYIQGKTGGTRMSVPRTIPGFEGLVQIGTSIFSMPAKAVTGKGAIVDITESAHNEMRKAAQDPIAYRNWLRDTYPDREFKKLYKHANHYIEGIKEASQHILDTSRSTISTTLGPDYTLAFQRSRMMNILDMPFTVKRHGKYGGHKSLRHLLADMQELVDKYQRSGGKDLTQKQAAVDAFYRNLVASVEGSSVGQFTLSVSGIKDKLFREQGVVSTLGASDITYGVSFSGLSKGYHQFAKLQPFHESALKLAGLSTPAATGLSAIDESSYISRLMEFEGYQAPGNYSARFGAHTFLSLGTVEGEGRLSTLAPSSILADSRSIAGKRLFTLSKYGQVRKTDTGYVYGPHSSVKHKTILLGGAGGKKFDDLEFHSEISDDVKEILRNHQKESSVVPKGMKRNSAGIYLYHKPKTIRKEGYPDSDIDFFLGRDIPPVQGELGPDDLKRALKGAGVRDDRLSIIGYKVSGKGGHALDILYEPAAVPGLSKDFAESAMIIHGRRVMQRQTAQKFMTTAGNAVDQILRAQELGIKAKLGEDFFSAVMANWIDISRHHGRLSEFQKFLLGHKLVSGPGMGPYLGLGSNQVGLGRNIFKNISKILEASPEELQRLGLSANDVSILIKKNNELILNPESVEYLRVGRELHAGIRLQGLETSVRAGMADRLKIGPGSMSMRLHDIIPMINQQWAGVNPKNKPLQDAYKSYHSAILGLISEGRTGRLGSIERTLPDAINQIASIYQSYFGTTKPFEEGMLKGIKGSSQVRTLSEWLKVGARPLSTNVYDVKQMISGPGLSEQLTAGTVHDTGYRGEVIRLPKAIKVAIGPSDIIETDLIPLPSDKFLGSSPTEMGKYLPGSGVRQLGLARRKAILAAMIHEQASTISTGKYSKEFRNEVRRYLTSLMSAMPAKEGLLYKNLVGEPSGSFYGTVVNWGSIPSKLAREETIMSLGMNPRDVKSLLKAAGYEKPGQVLKRMMKGEQEVFVNAMRYPWHQGSNLGFMKLIASKKIARDRIAVPETQMMVSMGDFDKDTIAGMLIKEEQDNMRLIHRRRLNIMKSYDRVMRNKERDEIVALSKKLQSGSLSSGDFFDKLLSSKLTEPERAQAIRNMAQRLGSAAGGGVYVGPVHMGWARMTALSNAIAEDEGIDLINRIGDVDQELEIALEAIRKDRKFQKLVGPLQETGVYGILKKGAAGFGTEEMSALSALIKYGEGKISLEKTKSVFLSGFRNAEAQGLFHKSELPGITPETMVEQLFSGRGHEGIGTLAKLRAMMKSIGAPDVSYEIARGYDPTRRGGSKQLLTKRIRDTIHSMTGREISLTQGSPEIAETTSAIFTNMINDAADQAPTMEERIAESTTPESRIGKTISNIGSQLKGMMDSRWGKRIMIGAGVVLGIGALDSLFGSSGEDPVTPQFVGPSPPPPRMDFDFPDAGIGMPSAEQFSARSRAPARIERPTAQRANYHVSATAGDNADFSYMMGGYMGTVGAPPIRDAYITDHSRDIDIDYELRRQFRASF